VFALAHNLTFLVTYGGASSAALARTGHGAHWTATVALVAILALALATAGAIRLIQLSRLSGELDRSANTVANGGAAVLARHLGRAWLQILVGSIVLFVCAENLERIAIGLPAPGLSVLGSDEYQGALAIFAVMALVAALIDGLYRWRRDVLVARIEAARARWGRIRLFPPRRELPWVERRHGAIVGYRVAGRAPPLAGR
jgi:hypothetical protein